MPSMALELHVTEVGPALWDAVRQHWAAAHRVDPLGPVTVVVPSTPAAISLRRWLGATAPGGRGVVGLQCSTLHEALATVAQVLGVDHPPRWSPVAVAGAVRGVLAERDDLAVTLGEVPEPRPPSVTALVGLVEELRGLSQAERRALRGDASDPASRAALEVAREAMDRLDRVLGPAPGPATDQELARAIRSRPEVVRRLLGPVLVLEPEGRLALRRVALGALGEVTSVRVLVGRTGDPVADQVAVETARRLVDGAEGDAGLEPERERPGQPGSAPQGATEPRRRAPRVLRQRAPALDSEVLAALRFLVAEWEQGTPLEELALLHPGTGPVARAALRAVQSSGLPHDRPGDRRLADCWSGRVLCRVLDLGRGNWDPRAVVALLESGPVRDPIRGGLVPVRAWVRIVRAAGARGDVGQWQERLAAYADLLVGRGVGGADGLSRLALAERSPWGPSIDPELLEGDATERVEAAGEVARVQAFLGWLADWVAAEPTGGWVAWSRWCEALLRGLLGDAADAAEWPAEEREARDAVLGVVEELGTLDALEPVASPEGRRAALSEALRAWAPSVTRAGRGLLVAPIDAALGVPLRVAAIVGMADGVLPPPLGAEGLWGWADAPASGGLGRSMMGLGRSALRRQAELRRAMAWVVQCCERVLLSTSRSAPTGGGPSEPSAWWECPPGAGREGEVEELGSHLDVVTRPGPAVGALDARLRSVVGGRAAGRSLVDLVQGPGRGLQRAGRPRSSRVPAACLPGEWPAVPLAPSALERFCVCPQRFFLADLLGLEEPGELGPLGELDPRVRGQVVHRVLQELTDRLRAAVEEPSPEEVEALLRELVAREGAAAQAWLGASGPLWEQGLADLADDLWEHVRDELGRRRQQGIRVVATEHPLGGPGGVPLVLPGGRRLVVRGVVDRLDRLADGRLALEDYKTGSARRLKAVNPGQPAGGGAVQLCTYLLAVEAATGEVVAEGAYQLVGRAERPDRRVLPFDPEVRERSQAALAVVAAALALGAFPTRPGKAIHDVFEHCQRCPYDRACPPDRKRIWEEARRWPEFGALAELVGDTSGTPGEG